jgi:hypothetical protein
LPSRRSRCRRSRRRPPPRRAHSSGSRCGGWRLTSWLRCVLLLGNACIAFRAPRPLSTQLGGGSGEIRAPGCGTVLAGGTAY